MPGPNVSGHTRLELPASEFKTRDISIPSRSGTLRGKLTESANSTSTDGVILCPGLAVGMEGDFVRQMEHRLLSPGLVKWSLRFNFFGHGDSNLNSDIRGFTFSRAIDDYSAGVALLRKEGAQRVIAVCSSTGAQPAVLAGCADVDGEKADLIVARAAVLDCFSSVIGTVPTPTLEKWKSAGVFQFPVGGNLVTMGADLLSDIERWRSLLDLSNLQVPLVLFHGEDDKTVPLQVVRAAVVKVPAELITLNVLSGVDHDFSATTQFDIMSVMAQEIAVRFASR